MSTVAAADPSSNILYNFSTVGQLHEAIKTYDYIPTRPDGTPYVTQVFEGGYLLDGAPLNVYIEGAWFAGQKELLQPYWDNGSIPKPTANILNVGSVAMPADVAANYAAYQNAGTSGAGFMGLPTPVIIGGLALLAWKFLK